MDTPAEQLSPRYIFAGRLTRDYILQPDGQARLDVPGGNAVYAAAGLAVWEPQPPPGLVARVGEDYPQRWLDEFASRGFDTRGVHVLPEAVDLREFIAYTDRTTRVNEDPVAHFARLGLPFPKVLLGYQNKHEAPDSRNRLTPVSLRQGDLIPDYLDATAAHICPLDYLTHSLMPAVLRQSGFTTVTLDPSSGYMNPTFRDDLAALVTGLTAFLPSEEELRTLYQGSSSDLWEMAEDIAAYGCELVVVKRGVGGVLLYDAGSKARYEAPPYPSKVVDVIGAGDAFCGGFMAGYRRTFEPVEAVLYGNISASLAIEGRGPYYPLDAMPGLARARLESLRPSVRKL